MGVGVGVGVGAGVFVGRGVGVAVGVRVNVGEGGKVTVGVAVTTVGHGFRVVGPAMAVGDGGPVFEKGSERRPIEDQLLCEDRFVVSRFCSLLSLDCLLTCQFL